MGDKIKQNQKSLINLSIKQLQNLALQKCPYLSHSLWTSVWQSPSDTRVKSSKHSGSFPFLVLGIIHFKLKAAV